MRPVGHACTPQQCCPCVQDSPSGSPAAWHLMPPSELHVLKEMSRAGLLSGVLGMHSFEQCRGSVRPALTSCWLRCSMLVTTRACGPRMSRMVVGAGAAAPPPSRCPASSTCRNQTRGATKVSIGYQAVVQHVGVLNLKPRDQDGIQPCTQTRTLLCCQFAAAAAPAHLPAQSGAPLLPCDTRA